MATLQEAREAQLKLLNDFNAAATAPVNGAQVKNDAEGYYVSIYLERSLTKEEAAKAPKECKGVRVKYEIAGPFNTGYHDFPSIH